VDFDSVTLEFKKGKEVYLLVDQQLGYAASLLDLAGISTEFSEAITTQFCFTYARYALEGVTAMPRELHARLCHAFLVIIIIIITRQLRIPDFASGFCSFALFAAGVCCY